MVLLEEIAAHPGLVTKREQISPSPPELSHRADGSSRTEAVDGGAHANPAADAGSACGQ
jgi:hypothetical protein